MLHICDRGDNSDAKMSNSFGLTVLNLFSCLALRGNVNTSRHTGNWKSPGINAAQRIGFVDILDVFHNA